MRGIIYDDQGNNQFSHQLQYHPTYHKDGSVEQDAATFYNYCVEICQKAAEYAKENNINIRALSMTAQRSSLIPTKNGVPTHTAIMWQDTRVNGLVRELHAYDEFFIKRSGSRLNAVYLGPKISWLKHERPQVYEESDKMLNISSYLIYTMTGQYTMDTTYGSRTNIMNIKTQDWDKDLLKILEIDVDKLPKLCAPGKVAGNLTKEFAELTGLKEGTPLISAGGDQQCAAMGEGLLDNDSVSINTGTGGYVIKNIDELPEVLSDHVIYNISSVPGKYILEIDLLACSSVLNWFIDNFYECRDYTKINADIKSCYDKNINVTAIPYPKGKSVGNNDTQIRTSFSNIGLSTTKADMLYSLMMSLFVEINDGIDILRSYGPVSSVIIGGGLTNSEIMNQMQSDAYDLTLHKSAVTESTSIGALISVLVNQGVYSTFQEAHNALVHGEGEIYTPNHDNKDFINDFAERKSQLYDVLRGTKAGYYKKVKKAN